MVAAAGSALLRGLGLTINWKERGTIAPPQLPELLLTGVWRDQNLMRSSRLHPIYPTKAPLLYTYFSHTHWNLTTKTSIHFINQ